MSFELPLSSAVWDAERGAFAEVADRRALARVAVAYQRLVWAWPQLAATSEPAAAVGVPWAETIEPTLKDIFESVEIVAARSAYGCDLSCVGSHQRRNFPVGVFGTALWSAPADGLEGGDAVEDRDPVPRALGSRGVLGARSGTTLKDGAGSWPTPSWPRAATSATSWTALAWSPTACPHRPGSRRASRSTT